MSISDAANQLKAESTQISVSFDLGVPTPTTGTISWNIPKPANGCSSDLRYSGIVFVPSTSIIKPENYPTNGKRYIADPTLNFDLHAGDKIGDGYVIGAFYEGTSTQFTTSFVVTDVTTNTAIYICGFPVDIQNNYFRDGIRAYSDQRLKAEDPSLPSTQTIEFQTPIVGSTGTNLVPGFLYTFDCILDTNYDYAFSRKRDPRTSPTAQIISFTIDGTNAGTYDDLVTEIRKQISKANNPILSPVAPNTGFLYWNNSEKKLYQFDGTNHILVNDVLYEPSDPSVIINGTMWLNHSTGTLNVYNAGWVNTPYINSVISPSEIVCANYWFDNTNMYKWNGTTWCEHTVINQTDDPSCPVINCGGFWFDQTNSILNKWNSETNKWDITSALYWDIAPNALLVGTYWFDLSNDLLFSWDGASWDSEVPLIISETQPTTPAINSFWFKKSTEELKQWDGLAYNSLDVIVWASDPSIVQSCTLWWRSTDETLFVWDVVHSTWDQIINFTMSDFDPHLAPEIDEGVIWYNSNEDQFLIWDGATWNDVDVVVSQNDPTIPNLNDYWYNEETKELKQWNGASWIVVDPIDSDSDPSIIATGTYWYNSSNNTLNVRNGLMWLNVMFVTSPLTPTKGTLWYDTSNDVLMEWNGSQWIESEPLITIEIKDGKLLFTSRDVGANVYLGVDDETNNTLFPALQPKATIWTPTLGGDGKSNVPSFVEEGVGTDGSPDERRVIQDNILRRLGAPTVDVELDQYTLDVCVNRALEVLRQRSMTYRRGFFFLDIVPRTQVYKLTNRQLGYHKIVEVMNCHRFTSAFMTSAHGSGAYGQVVLQQLYSLGTYDLTSYFMIAQYIEQMEMLFATRITFNWDEYSRQLSILHSFYKHETMLLDCVIERTEQELMTDRFTKPWIEKWAMAEAMFTLSQIRGKFSTLPGASGGITLNASDLASAAQTLKDECISEIENYIASRPEELGMESQFIIG